VNQETDNKMETYTSILKYVPNMQMCSEPWKESFISWPLQAAGSWQN